jgi:exodeoxyribonuclease VIII
MPQIHDRKEYRAFPALNQSAAKVLVGNSPAHYQAYINTPQEETKALRFGTFVHSAILEPHSLNDLYITIPGDAPKKPTKAQIEAKKPSEDTKEAIAWWKDFYAKHEGKIILDAEESALGHLVASSARFALRVHGVDFDATEVMYHVDYCGVPLKAAIDGVAGDYLWDIKTTGAGEATPAGMLKSIRSYRYNLQAYWYRLVYELATGRRPLGFRFLFVEKEPPFSWAIAEVGPELMSYAVSDFEKAITLYKECTASGVWPSYPEEIQVIDIKSTTTAAPINFA